MDSLITEILDADARAIWVSGIRGLRVNVDFLQKAGAQDEFLQRWEHGWPLDIASSLRPNHYNGTHPVVEARMLKIGAAR